MTRLRLMLMLCCILTAKLALAGNDAPDVKQLRKELVTAINSGQTTDSLYASLSKLNSRQPVIMAYIGTLSALKAKHTWNPYNKIKYLNQCQRQLQTAIAADPHNIEIRFMRFSIQHNVPAFLGYGKDLIADRDEMLKLLAQKSHVPADKEFTASIIRFLIDSKRCTAAENSQLHQHLGAL